VREGKITPDTLVWRDGMAGWQPWRELATGQSTTSPILPVGGIPGQSGAALSSDPALRDGPAWEHRETLGFVNAIVATVKTVLLEPDKTFATMKREGGIATPLLYNLILGCICIYINIGFQVMMGQAGRLVRPGFHSGGVNPAVAAFSVGFMLIAWGFLVPIALVIGSFIGAGIIHLSLMLVGGIKQPFETTYRVLCYCAGSTVVFQVIPVCGGVIAAVWNIVIVCIGMAKAHEISTGKAVLGVLLPTICCCGLVLVGGVLLFGAALGMSSHH